MRLILTEEQELLARSAKEMVQRKSPLSRARKLRDEGSRIGYSPEVWKEIASLGWTAIPFSEQDGGLGLGMADFVLVTESLGYALAPEPLISSVALAGTLIARGTSDAMKERWLPGLIDGSRRAAFAYEEPGRRFARRPKSCRAGSSEEGYVLDGIKANVLDAVEADAIVVSAASEAGPILAVVEPGAPGVEVTPLRRIDARNAAQVRLSEVAVRPGQILARSDGAASAIGHALDRATLALCGEMLGSMSRVFDMTMAYLNERTQFGVPIGSFQALQHRAAILFVERELARAAIMAAARRVDTGTSDASAAVSATKARCNDAFILMANEGIQMHGGIGMTDEHDVGLFLKRARAAEMTFGDSAYHRDCYARLQAY